MTRPLLKLSAIILAALIAAGQDAAAAELRPDRGEQEFQASVERLAVQTLMQRGAWEEVYAHSTAGLALAPDDPALLRGKIRALRQLGYGAAARKAVQQARASHPADVGLLLEAVWLTVIAGDWHQVLADTEQAAANADADSELLLLRGIALRETEQTVAAIELFSRLLARTPTDCVALTNRGRLLAQAGLHEGALADLTAATACPGHADPLLARGRLLLQLGKPAEALADLTRGLAIRPDDLTGLLASSEARFLLGDLEGAGRELQVARAIDAGDPRIETLSCRMASATGDWAVATRCAEQSVTRAPRDPAAWRLLAKARLEAGDLEGSIAAYDSLLTLAGMDHRARLERAAAQLLREDYAAATADCSAVIHEQPLAVAYGLRALAHYRAGNLAQAEEDSTNALVMNRHELSATLVRANLALERNDLQQATADCERAFTCSPTSPWGAITCGNAHLRAGNLDKALFYAGRARELAPADPGTRELVSALDAARQGSAATPTLSRTRTAEEQHTPAGTREVTP